MKRIVVDVNRCAGCRLCEMTCSFRHENEFSSSKSRITVLKEDFFGLDLPVTCWHCNPCSAMESCPSNAIQRKMNGLVYVEEEKCVGCGECVESCVIKAIKLHPEKNFPLICNQCGGKPLCVQECPTKALAYIEVEIEKPKLPSQILAETLKRWKIIA